MPEYKRTAAVMEYLSTYPHTPVIESDSIVSIYYFGKADTVILNSDFNLGQTAPDTMDAIACNGQTFFHRTFTLPADARIDYTLTIGTITAPDPGNPVITPRISGKKLRFSVKLGGTMIYKFTNIDRSFAYS